MPIDIDEEEVVSEQEDSLSEVSSIWSRKPRNANQHYGSTSYGTTPPV